MVDFPDLTRLRRRRSAKWTLYEPDVLPMPVAEMDVALAAPIAAALHEAVDLSDTGYPTVDGGLQRAFAGFAGRRWSWDVDPGSVLVAADVEMGAVETLRLALDPGDTVVFDSPVYPPFFEWPGRARVEYVDVPMLSTDAGGYRLDLEGLERAFDAGASAYLLCSPHNPLGHVHPREELEAVAELAEAYDVLVVADEIHAPLTLPGTRFTPWLDVSDAARAHGVALHSASKAWNLAGLKAALVVVDHPDVAERLAGLADVLGWSAGQFGVLGSEAAYRDGEAWLDELVEALAANHALLRDELARRLPEARCVPARAGFLAWVDLGALGWGDDPAEPALEHGRVALGVGTQFGPSGRGHVRVNVGCSPELVVEGVRRLASTADAFPA